MGAVQVSRSGQYSRFRVVHIGCPLAAMKNRRRAKSHPVSSMECDKSFDKFQQVYETSREEAEAVAFRRDFLSRYDTTKLN